ncbi:MAG: AAA family ATPase [Saprospiraceae bacterium]
MFIERFIEKYINEVLKYYPVLLLIGLRQAGKTTLLKKMFNDYRYISMENPENRTFLMDDPLGFMGLYDEKVIFDEAQKTPELFSYLQTIVDENRQPRKIYFVRISKFSITFWYYTVFGWKSRDSKIIDI